MRKIKSWEMFQSSYITEEVAWKDDIMNHIGECVPLTNTIVKLIFDNKRTTAFHITDSVHALGRAKAMMSSKSDAKKSLSCFTYCTEKRLTDTKITPHTGGGVLYYLEGNLLFSLNKDSMSKPDPSGRRWILNHNFPVKFRDELHNWLWTKVGDSKSLSSQEYNYDRLAFQDSKNKWSDFLRRYIVFIEGLVKKYAQDIRRYCDMYHGWQDPAETEEDEDDYNEIVINDIKVKEVLLNKKTILEYAKEEDINKIIEDWKKLSVNVVVAESEQDVLKWFHERGGITDYYTLIKGKEHINADW
jgi:hypothetical protein